MKEFYKKIFIVLLLIIIGGIFWEFFLSPYAREQRLVKRDRYQAVFLSNGQVYFGKIKNINSGFYILEDIYYFRYGDVEQAQEERALKTDISLIKLGEELHGPEDRMIIRRDKVLFWENLRDSSKVVEAIKKR